MIRFAAIERLPFKGQPTDDRLELRRDKLKPSWLPRGGLQLGVRRIERRVNGRAWHPTGYVVVVDPAHPYNLNQVGELLMFSRPHTARPHWKPLSLDSLAMAVDRIDESWLAYGRWHTGDKGLVAEIRPQMAEWKRLPEFQRRLIDIKLQQAGEPYRLSRTPDRQRVEQMLVGGVIDSLRRINPTATAAKLGGADRALDRQAILDGVSIKANRYRRTIVEEIIRHQLELARRVYADGSLDQAGELIVKLPAFGVSYLRNHDGASKDLVRVVMAAEMYFSTLYRQLSAIGRGRLDLAEVAVPPGYLDFTRLTGYDVLAEVVLGRLTDLSHCLDAKTRKRHTERTQSLLRQRFEITNPASQLWLDPDLSHYSSQVWT